MQQRCIKVFPRHLSCGEFYLAAKPRSCFLAPTHQRTGTWKIRLESLYMQQTWLEGCGQSMATPTCISFMLTFFPYSSVATEQPWTALTAPTRPRAPTISTSDFQISLRAWKSAKINLFLKWLYIFKPGWWEMWCILSLERYLCIISNKDRTFLRRMCQIHPERKGVLVQCTQICAFLQRCLTEQEVESTMGE